VIAVTTGRNPSQSTRRLCKELARHLPRAYRLVRGKLGLRQLADRLAAAGTSRLIVVCRGFGGPGQLDLMRLEDDQLTGLSPTIILRGVNFAAAPKRRYMAKIKYITADVKEAHPLGEVLSDFFELPLAGRERAASGRSLHISKDSTGGLRLAPINLLTGKPEGFTIFVKKLRW